MLFRSALRRRCLTFDSFTPMVSFLPILHIQSYRIYNKSELIGGEPTHYHTGVHVTERIGVEYDYSDVTSVIDSEYTPTREERMEDENMVHEFATLVHAALRKSKDNIHDVRY